MTTLSKEKILDLVRSNSFQTRQDKAKYRKFKVEALIQKKFKFWGIIGISALGLFRSLCSADEVTKVYGYRSIKELSYQGEGSIEIKQGDKNQLTITAHSKLLDHIHISNRHRKLRICTEDDLGGHPGAIRSTLEVNALSRIDLKGNVLVDIDKLQGDQLMINIESESLSTVEGFLDYQRVALTIHGDSKVILRGNVDKQMIYIKGSGTYLGQDLISRSVNIYTEGVSEAVVNPTKELAATAIGHSQIHYAGQKPATFKIDTSTYGRVSPYRLKNQ